MDFQISYRQSSPMMALDEPMTEPDEFVKKIFFEIHTVDESGNNIELAGKGKLSHLLFTLAMDLRYPAFHVMDATQSILDMSKVLFDWRKESDPWDKLTDHYDEPFMNTDVCVLDEIEILPKFRRKGLMAMVIKELNKNFYSACGLWVMNARPFQRDIDIYRDENDWFQKMNYIDFEEDEEISHYKLSHLFQSLGFEHPFDDDYFFARPYDLLTCED